MVDSPQTFQAAANKIGFTFNWFYADDQHIAYFNSGAEPDPARRRGSELPGRRSEERHPYACLAGLRPGDPHRDRRPSPSTRRCSTRTTSRAGTTSRRRPSVRLTSESLRSDKGSIAGRARIEAGIDGAETMTRADLVNAMEDAATVDLRGAEVLPKALKVVKSGQGQAQQEGRRRGGHAEDLAEVGRASPRLPTPTASTRRRRRSGSWTPGGPAWSRREFKPTLGDATLHPDPADDRARQPGRCRRLGLQLGLVRVRRQGPAKRSSASPSTAPYSREYCGGREAGRVPRRRCRRSLRGAQARLQRRALRHQCSCTDTRCDQPTPQWCHDSIRSTHGRRVSATAPDSVGEPPDLPAGWSSSPYPVRQAVESKDRTPATARSSLDPWPGSRPSRSASRRATRPPTPTPPSARWTRSRTCVCASRIASTRRPARSPWSSTRRRDGSRPHIPSCPRRDWRRLRPAAATWRAGRWPRSSTCSTTTISSAARRATTRSVALRGTAERLYAQIVVGAANPKLPPPWGPRRFARYLGWTWMVEGAAQYFAGQVPLFRAAVNTRLRQGKPPAFPPSPRDAIILGGTVFDLLERERGRDACPVLVSRLHRAAHAGTSSWPSTRTCERSSGCGGATCARRCPARARSTRRSTPPPEF